MEDFNEIPNEKDSYQNLRKSMRNWFESQNEYFNQYGDFIMLPMDLAHLTLKLSMDKRVNLKEKAKMAGTAAYLISPIDFIPEALFGPIGLVDDVALALIVLKKLLTETDPSILEEHWAGPSSTLHSIRAISSIMSEFTQETILQRISGLLNL